MGISLGGVSIGTYTAGSIATKRFESGPVFSNGLEGAPGLPDECTPQFIWEHGSEVARFNYDARQTPYKWEYGSSFGGAFTGLNLPGYTIYSSSAYLEPMPGSQVLYRVRYEWKPGGVYLDNTEIEPQWSQGAALSIYENYYEPYYAEQRCHMMAVKWESTDGGAPLYLLICAEHSTRYDSDGQKVADEYVNVANSAVYINFNPIRVDLDFQDEPDPEPGDETTPEPSEPGGYRDGDEDDTSDVVPKPDDPPLGITDCGFINVYNPAPNALRGLGDILFPNVATATDVAEAVIKLCETMANQNLINYVIDCHVIPVQPTVGQTVPIKVGFRNTGINVPAVTSDYVNVSCGSLNIREYFANYADYLYTKSKLWLPFLGFVDVRPEFWQAGTISVDYKFNVIDGSFMAYISSTSSKSQLTNSVIAEFGGNACMHFPITGANYASMASGLVSAAISAAETGGGSAVLGAAYSAANSIAQGGEVQQSNGYNSTNALLGVRTPYLMIERPAPSYPASYKHDRGFPSNITVTLGNISGYTEIEKIDLSGIPLTDQELTELRGLLADGVYF